MDNNSSRLAKAAGIFDTGLMDNVSNMELKTTMLNLERLKHKELRLWWDATTLKSYCVKNMIPRGHRLKKVLTAKYTDEFMEEWNKTLSECSLKLMGLIIQQEETQLKEINEEIKVTTDASTSEYVILEKKTEESLQKLEESVMATKRSKFSRDLNDYKNNKVYM